MTMDADEIRRIREVVERWCRVYDVRWDDTGAMFYVILTPTPSRAFADLQSELRRSGYVSGLRRMGGEDVIVVGRSVPHPERAITVNVILLILTIASTVWAGSIMWASSYGTSGSFADSFRPENLAMGAVTFALPLMFILGVHEMGHYLMARRYGMNASLPYFIPAPPPIIFGTFGAFISIRDPMPNRRALFDIGIAGPLSGFVAAIPVVMIGLYLTTGDVDDVGRSGDYILLHLPLLYVLLQHLVPPSGTLLHPTAFAGWVGLLVTAMNLLPAGQLDGGHIARAFLRDRAKYAAYGSIAVLLLLGLAFPGWIVFAFLIFFLGLRHPPPLDDVTTLDGKRKAMGAVVVLVMVLSFVPIPWRRCTTRPQSTRWSSGRTSPSAWSRRAGRGRSTCPSSTPATGTTPSMSMRPGTSAGTSRQGPPRSP
ncbi:MAG TPA: site-2 protease family protein [Thermoplasmata archaeon]|nr:site-2 protease family protein [Thermoplasmata archaeon]